ncbi:MAG TPA: hypothetical protein VF189_02410 [Patescibacteria group bacterium]
MDQKFISIGNSTGIIIPKEVLKELGFKGGELASLSTDATTKSIIISKKNQKNKFTVSPRLLTILDKVNKEYGQALKKLAQL